MTSTLTNYYNCGKFFAWNGGVSLRSLSQIPPTSFKATYHNQTITESSKLEIMYISWGSIFDLPSLFQSLEIWWSLWCYKVKIGSKGVKFVYYIPIVTKRSNSITMAFARLVIHFWDQYFKIVILWPIPNPSLWLKEAQICVSSAVSEEKVKTHR